MEVVVEMALCPKSADTVAGSTPAKINYKQGMKITHRVNIAEAHTVACEAVDELLNAAAYDLVKAMSESRITHLHIDNSPQM